MSRVSDEAVRAAVNTPSAVVVSKADLASDLLDAREALQRIAAIPPVRGSSETGRECPCCGRWARFGLPIEHAPDCPVSIVRAALATEGKEGDR